MSAEWRPIGSLRPDPKNVRLHDEPQIELLRASVREFGQVWPILARKDGTVVAHHGILEALKREGYEEAKVAFVEGMSAQQIAAFAIADNRLAMISDWDESALKAEVDALAAAGFNMEAVGYSADALEKMLSDEATRSVGSLAEAFGVPPFTILNARSGDWQKRKDVWLAMGIRSEEGRGENLLKFSDSVRLDGGAYNERFKG
jgi:ParB-like chromosome segregation protein Spo0J